MLNYDPLTTPSRMTLPLPSKSWTTHLGETVYRANLIPIPSTPIFNSLMTDPVRETIRKLRTVTMPGVVKLAFASAWTAA